MPSFAQFHIEESARVARAAHAKMMRHDYSGQPLRVYFKPKRFETFEEGADTSGWTLAWPEPLPSNLTVDQMIRYFAERTANVPYLFD